MTVTFPWRAGHWQGGFVAEFLPAGERTWRMLMTDRAPIVFPDRKAALAAAERAYERRLNPTILSTIPVDPDRIAQKMLGEREDWLKSKHRDVKRAATEYRPGKRPLLVMRGRA